jgi:hypothetical protein
MDTPARTALQDLLMTWNGDKLQLTTTSGKVYVGYTWLNHDASLVFLNKQPGAEDDTAVVVDRIESVRFLEAYSKDDDLPAGADRPCGCGGQHDVCPAERVDSPAPGGTR